MGWSIGTGKDGRDIGYGVPALCDYPDCNERIDRGLSYICGMINTEGEDRGCGLHFCPKHMDYSPKYRQLCVNCYPRMKKPLVRKPDLPEWIRHKLKDPSWKAWREEYPDEVRRCREQLTPTRGDGG